MPITLFTLATFFVLISMIFRHCIKFSFVTFFSDATYQKMLVQLAQCEFAIGKSQTVFEMNELETQNYEKIYSEIGKYK